MNLTHLHLGNGESLFINPQRVISIEKYDSDGQFSLLHLSDGSRRRAVGTPIEIAAKLQSTTTETNHA